MQDAQARCRMWVEQQFNKHKRLLVYQMISQAEKKFSLHGDVIMQIVVEVLREGCSA